MQCGTGIAQHVLDDHGFAPLRRPSPGRDGVVDLGEMLEEIRSDPPPAMMRREAVVSS
jgi:hypothetical protein